MSKRYKVWCLDHDETEDDGIDVVGYDIAKPRPDDKRQALVPDYRLQEPADAAEGYAEWFHARRDGWECSWPLRFRVRDEDGVTHDFDVERAAVPEFCAHKASAKDS